MRPSLQLCWRGGLGVNLGMGYGLYTAVHPGAMGYAPSLNIHPDDSPFLPIGGVGLV